MKKLYWLALTVSTAGWVGINDQTKFGFQTDVKTYSFQNNGLELFSVSQMDGGFRLHLGSSGVVYFDDGGIVIPAGCVIVFGGLDGGPSGFIDLLKK